ncbi:class I SAM-dependent methyltransferase [Nocardiopsis sediminis]|uniref:Class I SAM-dependent methyltransferase n=1 Tax=Nocardiopsis sediminis TaxID=1778267 RepID=A0ABV8FRP1_9ACTN
MGRRRLWTGAPPGRNPFALPRGLRGRLAGRIMARANRACNAELLAWLDVRAGTHVLEVGCGPGVLVELLTRRPDVRVTAVDPSAEMVAMAQRRNARAVRRGRVHIHPGDAAATGVDDGRVDLAISVNTVAMWPRLDDGMAELHRVLRSGGRAVIAWHRRPARFALAGEELSAVEAALANRFGNAERTILRGSVVFSAVKCG